MKRSILLVLVAVLGAGCQEATRGWERQAMPSHDRQRVFEAARAVFQEHFEIADANFVRGTIETEPQGFERRREGTLADLRGAGGQWRRTVFLGLGRDGLTVVARVAVLLEREATDAAVAMVDQHRTAPEDELPTAPDAERRHAGPRSPEPVWMEVGYEASLARELLSAIADRVRALEREQMMPTGQSPGDAAEEVRRIGAEQGF